MVKGKDRRQLIVIGACLLVIGGGFLPLALTTPPKIYMNSADQISGDSELSPSVLDTAVSQKSTITSIETVDGYEKKTLQNAVSNVGNWTSIKRNSPNAFDYKYITYRSSLYEVVKKDSAPAIKVVKVQGEERLEVLSLRTAEFPDQDHFGIRITDTQYEVAHQTLEKKRYGSFTHVNANNTILNHEGRFYRLTVELRQNSYLITIWSFLMVLLSLSLVSGIALLVYSVVGRIRRRVG